MLDGTILSALYYTIFASRLPAANPYFRKPAGRNSVIVHLNGTCASFLKEIIANKET